VTEERTEKKRKLRREKGELGTGNGKWEVLRIPARSLALFGKLFAKLNIKTMCTYATLMQFWPSKRAKCLGEKMFGGIK